MAEAAAKAVVFFNVIVYLSYAEKARLSGMLENAKHFLHPKISSEIFRMTETYNVSSH